MDQILTVLTNLIVKPLMYSALIVLMYLFCEIFYYRVIDFYAALRFYQNQGYPVKVPPNSLPLFGNLFLIDDAIRRGEKAGKNYHRIKYLFDETY